MLNREGMIPTKEEIVQDLKFFTGMEHRRTGSLNNQKSAEYIRDRFKTLGMKDSHIEHPETTLREYKDWMLKVDVEEIPCFFINGTLMMKNKGIYETNTGIINSELIYVGKGTVEDFCKADVKGKIVVADVYWKDYTLNALRNEHAAGDYYFYDPENTIPDEQKPIHKDSFTPNTFPYNYFEAFQRGATGFIGVLVDNCDHVAHFNEDYNFILEYKDTEEFSWALKYEFDEMELPGLWINRSSGEKIKELINSSSEAIVAEMQLSITMSKGNCNVIAGKLPGKTDEIVLVHSHHDSVFEGGVQDGAAMSCVMAVAKYFSEIPFEKREKTLMFAATDSHYTGYEGHDGFIKNRKNNNEKIILDIVVEHIGKEAVQNQDGQMVLTGETGLRLLYVNENEKLLEFTKNIVEKNHLERTLILPVNSEKGYVCSDGAVFHEEGIPVISMISPVIYLMDPIDTIDMVDIDQLVPVTKTLIGFVEEAFKLSADEIKENKFINYFSESNKK